MKLERCESCGSKNVKQGNVTIEYRGKTIKDVPVTVCSDCGEEMITSDVLEKIDELIASGSSEYQGGICYA